MDHRDVNALLIAVALHLGLAAGVITLGRAGAKRGPQIVELDVRERPPPPKIVPPPPPKIEPPPPEPPKKIVRAKVPPPPPAAPIPNREPPKDPPKDPPKPVFGVSMDSVTEAGGFTVPVGNTTTADPKTAGKLPSVAPLPAAPPSVPVAPVFRPASALDVKHEPDVDEESCKLAYPDGEAKDQGVEGDTLLRVEIDERGKVHGVKLLRGVGHGLDEAAMRVMRYKCRFGPAKNTANQPVPFVITYTYHWVIDR